jgi:phosphoribosylamine---glycine ligase
LCSFTVKILLIGGGAREHALAWKLSQSSQVERVWCAPGNAGIADIAECFEASAANIQELTKLAQTLRPDMTVIGPEQPLVLGIVDEFEQAGLRILGPSRVAAQLEGSKVFAKEFMSRHNIPTAPAYGVFDNAVDAYTSLCEVDWPVVVKADGLCGGKGVLVTSSPDEATAFIERLMEKAEFGAAGKRVVVEEGLVGRELSYIVLTDGEKFVPLAPTQDYKRAFDGDTGPNTGGMGAISSPYLLSKELERQIRDMIVRPTLAGMMKDGHAYRGFLYFGLMLTEAGPKVLEFNCRLGDPETEALVMRMDFDLASACESVLSGRLSEFPPTTNWAPAASVCVVLASDGYPGKHKIGQQIFGLTGNTRTDVAVFHAGVKREATDYYVCSGRVIAIAASADSVAKARTLAYEAAGQISFDGLRYRKDIGGEVGSAARQ